MKLYDDDGTLIGDLSQLPQLNDPDARYVLTVPNRLTRAELDAIGGAWRRLETGAKLICLEEGATLTAEIITALADDI